MSHCFNYNIECVSCKVTKPIISQKCPCHYGSQAHRKLWKDNDKILSSRRGRRPTTEYVGNPVENKNPTKYQPWWYSNLGHTGGRGEYHYTNLHHFNETCCPRNPSNWQLWYSPSLKIPPLSRRLRVKVSKSGSVAVAVAMIVFSGVFSATQAWMLKPFTDSSAVWDPEIRFSHHWM